MGSQPGRYIQVVQRQSGKNNINIWPVIRSRLIFPRIHRAGALVELYFQRPQSDYRIYLVAMKYH